MTWNPAHCDTVQYCHLAASSHGPRLWFWNRGWYSPLNPGCGCAPGDRAGSHPCRDSLQASISPCRSAGPGSIKATSPLA